MKRACFNIDCRGPSPRIMSMTLRLFSIWTWLWLVLLGSNIAAQEAPRPVMKTVEKIGLLPIKGEIDQISAQSLGRRLDQALADGCDAVVLHIDTPGGALDATFSMSHSMSMACLSSCVW